MLLTRAGTAKAQVIRRAHILLRASEDVVDDETATALHVARAALLRVRRRFATAPEAERVERALYDRPRPGGERALRVFGPMPPFGFRPLLYVVVLLETLGFLLFGFGFVAEQIAQLHAELDSLRKGLGEHRPGLR